MSAAPEIRPNIGAIKSLMKEQGLTINKLAETSYVNKKTISKLLNKKSNPRKSTLDKIAKALGVKFSDIAEIVFPDPRAGSTVRKLPYTKNQMMRLGKTLRIAISRAVIAANDVVSGAYIPSTREEAMEDISTDQNKIRSPNISTMDDPTKLIDHVTYIEIVRTLSTSTDDMGNPLSGGFYMIDEEHGCQKHFVKQGSDIIIFVDSTDDTTRAMRGLGGTSLISVYKLGSGWIAAAIGDHSRRRVYWRLGDKPSHGLEIPYDYTNAHRLIPIESKNDDIDMRGWPLELGTSGVTNLLGASLNIYTGKVQRLLTVSEKGQTLLENMGYHSEILSEGGSRGILLVAEGLIDASVEWIKGFRPIDRVPGCYIAQGANAEVVDLDNVPVSFGVDPEFEDTIIDLLEDFRNELFDHLRESFIVASSESLAKEISDALK